MGSLNIEDRVRGLQGPAAPYGLEGRSCGGCPWSEQELAALVQGEEQNKGQLGAAPDHSIQDTQWRKAKAEVRIRLSEEPPTDSHLGASAEAGRKQGPLKNWGFIHTRRDWRSY